MSDFNLSFSLNTLIDVLNEVVYINPNPSNDSIYELKAAVYADTIINGDCEDLELFGRIFFRYYDKLKFKSNLIKIAHNRVNYIISSPNS